jgi:hypothetical protein
VTLPEADPSFWGLTIAAVTSLSTCFVTWLRYRQWRAEFDRKREPLKLPLGPTLVILIGAGLGLLLGQPGPRQALRIDVASRAVAAKKQPPKREGCTDKSCPSSCACSGNRCDCPVETQKKPTSLAAVPPWMPQPVQVFEERPAG